MVEKSVIRGTRITVELILRLLAQGQNIGEILKAYPRLEKEDISLYWKLEVSDTSPL